MAKRQKAEMVQVEERPLIQVEGGGATPTSPLQLKFKSINHRTAIKYAVKYHYLHRKAPVTWAFGAFYDGFLVGILTIGKPASHTLLKGVCGEDRAKDVFELNRLWMDDKLPKNSGSRFIGWALRQLPLNTILVSYADTAYKHLGRIYQATNWIYTGTSIPFTDYTKEGLDHRSIPKSERDKATLDKVTRSKKHRYVHFCNKADKKLLKWKVMPYPKDSI